MSNVKPHAVNHIAVATRDIRAQIAFFTDVLGLPLRALYRMHGAEGAFHGFVELNPASYVAFVYHPDNPDTHTLGVTHAGTPAGAAAGGALQHIAFTVDSIEQLMAMRDRIRSRGVPALGPLDHGFCQSIYFAGPEGLVLEVSAGEAMDPEAWIDPEVVALTGISAEELEKYRSPEGYQVPQQPVTQPGFDPEKPHLEFPTEVYSQLLAMSDEVLTKLMSEPDPPVRID